LPVRDRRAGEERGGRQTVKLADEVRCILDRLAGAGFRAWVVGGAVRDWLGGREPADWDVATDARPEEVLALFPGARTDGAEFGRVLVGDVDVVTLRRDGVYRDARRPSTVEFTASLEEDLARRDFTINAMAWAPEGGLVDPYGGREDLRAGVIRAVGDARRRMHEDALRVLRALRFQAQLGFSIDPALQGAMREFGPRLSLVARERVAQELEKLLLGPHAGMALRSMRDLGLVGEVIPPLVPCVDYDQSTPHHLHDLYEHTVRVVEGVPAERRLRLAALLHDCGKPLCRTIGPDGVAHYYGHAKAGAKIAGAYLRAMRFPERVVGDVYLLIRRHMTQYYPETQVTAMRRLVGRLGPELARALVTLKRADALGRVGFVPPGIELMQRHLEEVLLRKDPVTEKDLALDGHAIMAILGIGPGPAVGQAKRFLLEAVREDPSLNTPEALAALLRERAVV